VKHQEAIELLKDETAEGHQAEIEDLIRDMTDKCNLEKEKFKQAYTVQYENDIAVLNS